MPEKALIIGIAGVTCGGKTTLAASLAKRLPGSRVVSQDDYFLPEADPRHEWLPALGHVNFDVPASLDMARLGADLRALARSAARGAVLIVEGFLIFSQPQLLELFGLRYFVTLPREECWRRRQRRVYDPPDCPGYFEQCVWPEYEKQLDELKGKADGVTYLDGSSEQEASLEVILNDLATLV